MTISEKELVAGFARAVAVGDASVFVGAGLSKAAGLPNWNELIEDAKRSANVPSELTDEPLAAEYIANAEGRGFLRSSIRRKIDVPVKPTPAHITLAKLPIRDYWTTNYDLLIEESLEQCGRAFQRIVGESDYIAGATSGTATKRITKMHGSLNRNPVGRRGWEALPVITRADFERFEEHHPITWSRLRATWLTNSFLFLGLSFDDPNLNLLLRLSRSLPSGIDSPPHYVVFSKKSDPTQARLQELRVSDLENSGVRVHMVDSHSALEPLLSRLEVRCREAVLFVSGSFKEPGDFSRSVAEAVAVGLAGLPTELELKVCSFGGKPGQVVGKTFREALPDDTYTPDRIRFYHRKAKDSSESLFIEHRVGITMFTEMPAEEMRSTLFPRTRAIMIVEGGSRTEDEVEVAKAAGVNIVPVAATGGAALSLWEKMDPKDQGLTTTEELMWWEQLASKQPAMAAHGATNLLRRLMFQ